MLKVKNLSQNATGKVKLLETLKNWVLFKNRWVFRKISYFLKVAKGPEFAVECD